MCPDVVWVEAKAPTKTATRSKNSACLGDERRQRARNVSTNLTPSHLSIHGEMRLYAEGFGKSTAQSVEK